MRFIGSFFGLLGIASADHMFTTLPRYYPSSYCSDDAMQALASHHLVEFILINCTPTGVSPAPVLSGAAQPGPNICWEMFLGNNTDIANLFPANDSGMCGETVLSLVTGMTTAVARNYLGSSTYNTETGVLTLDPRYVFGDDTYLDYEIWYSMGIFQNFNGKSVMGSNQCNISTIQKNGIHNAFTKLIYAAATDAAYSTIGMDNSSDVFCDFCYRQIYEMIMEECDNHDPVLKATCTADSTSDACVTAPIIQTAMNWFENCSGTEINFLGPACSADEKSVIDSIKPGPYQVSMLCKFLPWDAAFYCDALDDYWTYIDSVSSLGCLGCYRDFYDNLVTDTSVGNTCAVDIAAGNYNSATCIAHQQNAFMQFQICAGHAMSTDV